MLNLRLQRLRFVPIPDVAELDSILDELVKILVHFQLSQVVADSSDERTVLDYLGNSSIVPILIENLTIDKYAVSTVRFFNQFFQSIEMGLVAVYFVKLDIVETVMRASSSCNASELLNYKIAFLKNISMKFSACPLEFWFNEVNCRFPLFAHAILYQHHTEPMVRIGGKLKLILARTVVLNLLNSRNAAVIKFILRDRAYFMNLIIQFTDYFNSVIAHLETGVTFQAAGCVDNLIDLLDYFNELLDLQVVEIIEELLNSLVEKVVMPLINNLEGKLSSARVICM